MARKTSAVRGTIATHDPIWSEIRAEAEAAVIAEPALGGFLFATVLSHKRLEDSVVHRISQRLNHSDVDGVLITRTFTAVLDERPELGDAFRADLAAVYDRDPACSRYMEPLLYFKGFHSLTTHRFAHELWRSGRKDFALYMQSQSARIFSTDIHPAARFGKGIMFDHANGIVVGETAVVGDNCSFLHSVTLGGSGKETGDRHPKIEDNVLVGAGAKILGNIRIGRCSRIAAGSVVLNDVPPNRTMAGVPARDVGPAGCPEPARSMEQGLEPDDCGCGKTRD